MIFYQSVSMDRTIFRHSIVNDISMNSTILRSHWAARYYLLRSVHRQWILHKGSYAIIQGVSKLLQHAGETWLIRQVLVENPRLVTQSAFLLPRSLRPEALESRRFPD